MLSSWNEMLLIEMFHRNELLFIFIIVLVRYFRYANKFFMLRELYRSSKCLLNNFFQMLDFVFSFFFIISFLKTDKDVGLMRSEPNYFVYAYDFVFCFSTIGFWCKVHRRSCQDKRNIRRNVDWEWMMEKSSSNKTKLHTTTIDNNRVPSLSQFSRSLSFLFRSSFEFCNSTFLHQPKQKTVWDFYALSSPLFMAIFHWHFMFLQNISSESCLFYFSFLVTRWCGYYFRFVWFYATLQ